MLRLSQKKTPSSPRARRAAIKLHTGMAARACAPAHPVRARRGLWMLLPALLRRCAMGTNQISCFGIWRQGTRRQAARINRSGETRWHRCNRSLITQASRTNILREEN